MMTKLIMAAAGAMLMTYGACAQTTIGKPGDLVAGSGSGYAGEEVFFPNMRFPLERGPAYANSQVWGAGGMNGPGGGECAPVNYSHWHDNFCETRSWSVAMCPGGKGHQGQDIRPASCQADVHWAVAAEDGIIANVGSYSVTLQTKSGRLYRYLHLNMDPRKLEVGVGDHVKRGDRIGLVSNWFAGNATTIHLHFDVKDNYRVGGKLVSTYMPAYASLLDAYNRLLAGKP